MKDLLFHEGEFIRKRIGELSLSVKEFADLIHLERTTVYKILKQRIINRNIVEMMSKALRYDLFSIFYEKRQLPRQDEIKFTFEIDLTEDEIKKLENQHKIQINIYLKKQMSEV